MEYYVMEERILASVNGMNVTEQDVINEITAMGERGRQFMSPQGQAIVLEQLINRKLILAGAKRDLIEFDKEYKAQLNALKDELLIKYAISKTLSGLKVTDEEAKKYYDEHPEDFNPGEVISASHILSKDEELIKKLKADIESGAVTFEDAARKHSECPSGQNGGALGEFTRGQMVKEFDEVAFSLEIDVISEPVQTQFGWHIIKVTDKKEASVLAFDDIKEQLKEQLLSDKQQKAYQSRINQLKILFPVDKF